SRGVLALVLIVLPVGLLCLVNDTPWGLLALPLLLLAKVRIPVPRSRRAFYFYYMGHLLVLSLLSYALL
ncbi:TraX family protein, partial [Xanthomonas euvesicatoria]